MEFRHRLVHDEDLVSVWLLRGNLLDEEEMIGGGDMKLAARAIRIYLEKVESQAQTFQQVKLICVGEGNVRRTWHFDFFFFSSFLPSFPSSFPSCKSAE